MKISDLIKNLFEILLEEGDLECCYASDAEGNNINEVEFDSSIMYKRGNEYFSPADIIIKEKSKYKKVACIN